MGCLYLDRLLIIALMGILWVTVTWACCEKSNNHSAQSSELCSPVRILYLWPGAPPPGWCLAPLCCSHVCRSLLAGAEVLLVELAAPGPWPPSWLRATSLYLILTTILNFMHLFETCFWWYLNESTLNFPVIIVSVNSTSEFINTDANVLKQVLAVVVVRLLCLIAGLKRCSLRFPACWGLDNNRKLHLLVHFSHMYVHQKKSNKWTETCEPVFLESPILYQVITVFPINTSYQGSNRTQATMNKHSVQTQESE